ncbi:NADPH--cytochrome P450 reductase 1-like isoform X3 [Lolium perenne]|uniref:NADPH--cytochrome P450 reductase 1-like isoform X3 n=1 Tax=Lolium perenne TaxID=4522 RepID=UPI0021F63CD6|nr:NADPH--cytochrome P450 reductase 1-like isoform X1 [Lolium perenne]
MVMAGRDYQDGCQRVALFFGTQIGATEEFAKLSQTLVEEAKARYDKVVFTVVDLDDYGAEDEDRGVPGKAQEVEHGAALPGNRPMVKPLNQVEGKCLSSYYKPCFHNF